MTAVEHHADEAPDIGDGPGGTRLAVGRNGFQSDHVVVEPGRLLGRQIQVVHAEFTGLADDRVIDVCHIAHALRVVSQVPQAALKYVIAQVRSSVPQMRGVVRGDPARVHRDDFARLERHNFASTGVVQAHRPALVTHVLSTSVTASVLGQFTEAKTTVAALWEFSMENGF